jgi:hypothetical protein
MANAKGETQMKTSQTFAFRLAKRDVLPTAQWKAREGAAVAGCSGPDGFGNYRSESTSGRPDAGVYC